MVDRFGITDATKTNVKYLGVRAKPIWDFIPIKHYVLSVLHLQMGLFNDIDDWFMDSIHEIIVWSPREKTFRQELDVVIQAQKEAQVKVTEFDKTANGKKRSNLLSRRNKSKNGSADPSVVPLSPVENEELDRFEMERSILVDERKAMERRKKKITDELSEIRSRLKRDSQSCCFAIEQKWKEHRMSKAAYHGGKWNGKHSRDVMKYPEKYYGGMREIILRFKHGGVCIEKVDRLLGDVKELLSAWYSFFTLYENQIGATIRL
jgi:hypothetical protein